jgi:hypothetical protein
MLMGLWNSPPIHQCQVVAALREYIGKICHVCLNDIIIWSQSMEERKKHVQLILAALHAASLYCNPDKCQFFQLEIDFLGHRISANGIEPQSSKVNHVLDWPVPKSAKEVCSFLGLIRYIATFLPKLAEYTCKLMLLTSKVAKQDFPRWTDEHQHIF